MDAGPCHPRQATRDDGGPCNTARRLAPLLPFAEIQSRFELTRQSMKSVTIAIATALVVLSTLCPARDFATANEQARFLAGLPVPKDSPLAPLTDDNAWQQHANELDQAWSRA